MDADAPADGGNIADTPDTVAVGRIGPAHGVLGEVFVEPWTDDPDGRFAVGARLLRAGGAPLEVASRRYQGARLVVRFVGVDDRAGAQALRASVLSVPATDRPALDDPNEFYDSDLVGLRARTAGGADLGEVTDVVHVGAQDYLSVRVGGRDRLVPFVSAIVPTVDLAAGVVVIDPPEGLFEL